MKSHMIKKDNQNMASGLFEFPEIKVTTTRDGRVIIEQEAVAVIASSRQAKDLISLLNEDTEKELIRGNRLDALKKMIIANRHSPEQITQALDNIIDETF